MRRLSEMTASIASGFKKVANNPNICKGLLNRLGALLSGRKFRFMEVCGTHTTAIFQSGLRSMLPENVEHLSGPGCPVCVTHDSEVELFLRLAENPEIILATFGDLLRVPGKDGRSLKLAKAMGGQVEIVYSPLEAISLAEKNTDYQIVFLGAGFETTAPAVAAAILKASQKRLKNFSVFSFHKLVPPALCKILSEKDHNIDAFLLPGHVAAITGLQPFAFLANEYAMPGVVGGFEPVDILLALCDLAEMAMTGRSLIKNDYPRVVADKGSPAALEIMNRVFQPVDSQWRGLGKMPESGLGIRKEFSSFDALKKFAVSLPATLPAGGCKCGEILKGRLKPIQCPLFGKKCTPANPVGPCMVSTEGSCSAHYKYGAAGCDYE